MLVSSTLLLFLIASDITDELEIKQGAGYGLLVLQGLSCLINLGSFMVRVGIEVVKKVKIWCRNRKKTVAMLPEKLKKDVS